MLEHTAKNVSVMRKTKIGTGPKNGGKTNVESVGKWRNAAFESINLKRRNK
jgi:hypothetical protein